MPARAFLDSNVVIYAFSEGERRQERSLILLHSRPVVSVQVLNEFVSVRQRKMARSWSECADEVAEVRRLCDVEALTAQLHSSALRLAAGGGLNFYDALIVAAALESGCEVLWSEDMQAGRRFGALTVRNPFVGG